MRSLYVDEAKVEAALLGVFGEQPPRNLLDIGTGTGRILQLFAPRIGFGLGLDLSREMLSVARANLDRTSLRNCQVRHGDMYHLPLPDGSFDAATMHNVLHFADDPSAALAEAARVLRPGGRLVVIDFARHELEFLRREHAHRRLGFTDAEMHGWFTAAGLLPEPPVRLAGDAADRRDLDGAPRRRQRRRRAFICNPGTERGGMNASRARAFSERRFAWLGEPLPDVAISFEFFPPKTADAEARLWQAVDRLAPFQPNYVSVTCGAGGNPAEGTAVLVDGLRERAGLRAAAHLTCATAPRATVDAIAERYWQSGIRHIVALRGDPPKDAALRPQRRALPLCRRSGPRAAPDR